jgi:hypothetical protein
LLDALDIAGMLAPTRCTPRPATLNRHRRGAHYLLPVKGNQPGIFEALDAIVTAASDAIGAPRAHNAR